MPNATPYWSGIPMDAFAPLLEDKDFPALKQCKDAYQSLIGSIGWLAHSTHADLSTVHSILSAYSNKPSTGHMKAALYALHYIHSTHDSFTSDNISEMHSFIHFPPASDVEAYWDALAPRHANLLTLLSYSNACWDSQIGNAIANETLLPLFKFCSMSCGIVFKNGGPLGWLAKRWESTSLSSCEAKIWATNSTSKKVVNFRNLCRSVLESVVPISDVNKATTIYNDNNACVQWSHNMTALQKTPFTSGFKIRQFISNTSLGRQIPLTSSTK